MDNNAIVELLRKIYPFKTLDLKSIELCTSKAEMGDFEAGELVYEAGESADHLHILIQGQVKLKSDRGIKIGSAGILQPGSIFGFETLSDNAHYAVNASYITNSKLIRITKEDLSRLMSQFPSLASGLRLLAESYQLAGRTSLQWKNLDEKLVYICRRHKFFLYIKLFFPFMILLAALFTWRIYYREAFMPDPFLIFIGAVGVTFSLTWMGYIILDWWKDYFIVTNKRVLKQKRILPFHDSRKEAMLNMVLAVGLNTDQIGRILKYGSANVRTYAGTVVFSGLMYPEEIVSIIQAEWFLVKETQGDNSTTDQIQQKIMKKLGYQLPDVKDLHSDLADYGSTLKEDVTESDGILNLLARIFQIRTVFGKEIVYRTHWFILLRRMIFPTLLLLLLQVTLAYRLAGGISELSIGSIITLVIILDMFIIVWWVYVYIDWRNDYYLLTDEYLVDVYKKPLGREERRSAPLSNIQSIEYQRLGIIGLILNFGTVHIIVGETTLTFDDVYNPSIVQQDIFDRLLETNKLKAMMELQAQEKKMGDWIEAYHHVTHTENSDTKD